MAYEINDMLRKAIGRKYLNFMYAMMCSELTVIIQGRDYGTAADKATHATVNMF